ncbi:hypothetical protein F5J12DRAFT_849097 [Pisolithus orientalis]|uniref:uncharacterized protein n=1 Tax=Pisolithus orientalis TaxID=936130 RepID=UPI002225B621|nr:uncharacterized protein F5J12DRAFT_849097 [Pisolithus orientalis]KAI5998515.1 hypothetical protein F5J12DRAFT_849097 [Pisolithus orientalis]
MESLGLSSNTIVRLLALHGVVCTCVCVVIRNQAILIHLLHYTVFVTEVVYTLPS